MVTESEIEHAVSLSAQGDLNAALGLYQEMVPRAHDDQTRMRILFGVVICSIHLGLNTVTEDAVGELERLSSTELTRAFVDLTRTSALVEAGKAEEALDLIYANLHSEIVESEDFRHWRYDYLFYKGESLTRLARCDEALNAFDAANAICPKGKYELDILIARSNCLMALGRYEDAFDAASQVEANGDQRLAGLALQYMAESRMWQTRVAEALPIYYQLQRKLPCKFVDENRIQTGMNRAIAYLEKRSKQVKPY